MYSVGNPFLKCSNCPSSRQGERKAPKTAFIAAIAREMNDERVGRDNDIDHNRTHENIWLIGESCDYYKKTEVLLKEHNTLRKEHGLRALRKDAVSAIAFIAKVPIEISSKNDFDYVRFYADHLKVVQELFNYEDNTKQHIKRCGEIDAAVIHLDEFINKEKRIRSPHLHGFVRPYIYEEDKDTGEVFKTLNAKKFYNKDFLDNFNRNYPRMMRELGWKEVRDCIITEDIDETSEKKAAKEKINGRDSIDYKADAEREKTRLLEDIDKKNKEIQRLEIELNQQQTTIKQQENEIAHCYCVIELLKEQHREMIKKIQELVKILQPLERLERILRALWRYSSDFKSTVDMIIWKNDITKEEQDNLMEVYNITKNGPFNLDSVINITRNINNNSSFSIEDIFLEKDRDK